MVSKVGTLGLFIIMLLFGIVINNPYVRAQPDNQGIRIAPTHMQLTAERGQQLTGKITVSNPGTDPLHYRTYANNFSVENEDYQKVFGAAPQNQSVTWFDMTDDIRELAPGGSEEAEYSLNIPQQANPGGYYVVIFTETVAKDLGSEEAVPIKRVGTLIYLTVSGELVEKGHAIGLRSALWHTAQPVKAESRVSNEGNVHFGAKLHIRVKDVLGSIIRETSTEGIVLPGTTRKFSMELPLSRVFGIYKLEGDVEMINSRLPAGSHWIIVVSPLGLGLAAALIGGWLTLIILRTKRRRAVTKPGQHHNA